MAEATDTPATPAPTDTTTATALAGVGTAPSQEGAGPAAVAPPTPEARTPVPANWRDDWRETIAKGDEKRLQRLQRYASPEALADALIAAQNRISSGELKTALPKDAKPEEITQWRKDNGIPEAPEKYELKFENGLVIGEKDKPIIDGFLKSAHQANLSTDQAKAAVEWYYQEQTRMTQARAQSDEVDKQAAQDALNAEWGTGYRKNVVTIDNLLNTFPEDVRDLLKGGRLANGMGIFNHPQVMRGFVALAHELNPAGTVVPGGGGDPAKSINDEISGIEKKMGTQAYISDEAMQARYRELVDARERMKTRAA